MKEQLEKIFDARIIGESRCSTGEFIYNFPAGILYSNFQNLMKAIPEGLECNIIFTSPTYSFIADGILQAPRTIIVNGQKITSDSISVSYTDQEIANKTRLEQIKELFKDKYV